MLPGAELLFALCRVQTEAPRGGGFTLASMRDMGAGLGMLVVETIAKVRRACQNPSNICKDGTEIYT
jgi:hypothetical protein